MRQIKYGGVLHPGDFIAISDGNHLNFGWYLGDGKNTLQYFTLHGPGSVYDQYKEFKTWDDAEKAKNTWTTKRFEKGFTIKCLWKSFVQAVHTTRIMKITNVEDIFTDSEDRQMYERSREALITLNFIQK